MSFPSDPYILLSYVNTKLRDEYGSLDDLCISLDVDKSWLTTTLAQIGFEYEPETNQFH